MIDQYLLLNDFCSEGRLESGTDPGPQGWMEGINAAKASADTKDDKLSRNSRTLD